MKLKFAYTLELDTYLQAVSYDDLEKYQRDFKALDWSMAARITLRHWLNNCVIHESTVTPAQAAQWLEALGTEIRRRKALL